MKVFFVNIQVKDPTWKYSGERSWPESDSAEQRGRRAPFFQLPSGGNSFLCSNALSCLVSNLWEIWFAFLDLMTGTESEKCFFSWQICSCFINFYLQGFSMVAFMASQCVSASPINFYVQDFSLLICRASQWSESRRPRVRPTARGAPPRQGCDQILIFYQILVFFYFCWIWFQHWIKCWV